MKTGRVSASLVLAGLIIVIGLVLNVVAYFLPIDYLRFGDYAYLGIVVLTFIGNASVVVPIPYVPVFLRVAEVAPNVLLVVLCAAVGSSLGESVSYFLGRSGRQVVSESRIYRWLHQVAHRPVLSWFFMLAMSTPPNPFFDVAGLAAGALGIPYKIFLSAVTLGRFLRFAALFWGAMGLSR